MNVEGPERWTPSHRRHSSGGCRPEETAWTQHLRRSEPFPLLSIPVGVSKGETQQRVLPHEIVNWVGIGLGLDNPGQCPAHHRAKSLAGVCLERLVERGGGYVVGSIDRQPDEHEAYDSQ